MGWFTKNAHAIEAGAAAVTAHVALMALIGVKVQLDTADRLQRASATRESDRGHLALAVANPYLATPVGGCALIAPPRSRAYTAFVDHLLDSAQLPLNADTGWEAVLLDELARTPNISVRPLARMVTPPRSSPYWRHSGAGPALPRRPVVSLCA
jgi:hypothetical protein